VFSYVQNSRELLEKKTQNFFALCLTFASVYSIFFTKILISACVFFYCRGDLEAIERITREAVEDKAEQNVVYVEFRFCPHVPTMKAGGSDFNQQKPVCDDE